MPVPVRRWNCVSMTIEVRHSLYPQMNGAAFNLRFSFSMIPIAVSLNRVVWFHDFQVSITLIRKARRSSRRLSPPLEVQLQDLSREDGASRRIITADQRRMRTSASDVFKFLHWTDLHKHHCTSPSGEHSGCSRLCTVCRPISSGDQMDPSMDPMDSFCSIIIDTRIHLRPRGPQPDAAAKLSTYNFR